MGRVPGSVDEYINEAPAEARRLLTELRRIVRKAAPQAIEGIRYGMPYYKHRGRPVVGFAAFKHHIGLYGSLAGHELDFEGYETERGTVRFPLDRPLPAGLIDKFVTARMAGIDAVGK